MYKGRKGIVCHYRARVEYVRVADILSKASVRASPICRFYGSFNVAKRLHASICNFAIAALSATGRTETIKSQSSFTSAAVGCIIKVNKNTAHIHSYTQAIAINQNGRSSTNSYEPASVQVEAKSSAGRSQAS